MSVDATHKKNQLMMLHSYSKISNIDLYYIIYYIMVFIEPEAKELVTVGFILHRHYIQLKTFYH